MKFRTLTCITAMTLFAALAIPLRLAAQEQPSAATPAAIQPQPGSGTTVPRLIKFSGVVSPETTQITRKTESDSNAAVGLPG